MKPCTQAAPHICARWLSRPDAHSHPDLAYTRQKLLIAADVADLDNALYSFAQASHVSLPTTRERREDPPFLDPDTYVDHDVEAEAEEQISVKHRPPSSATSYPSLDSRDGSIK